mgnify:CR=1 FL=1
MVYAELVILFLFGLFLSFIFCFTCVQGIILFNYLKKSKQTTPDKFTFDELPIVTIQLPIYNEKYVVKRLLQHIGKLNYPVHKLEIQVLDDSSDITKDILAREVQRMKVEGFDIQHIRRDVREGFKAGALSNGLKSAKGEFIAIFDADFTPTVDFLERLLPYFRDFGVGVVQSRWGHLNTDYSLLTKLQAFGLDAHFSIEQEGRSAGGHFINFNGTAGIWRKITIEESGGWHADTLTEDLDLSYRAQLKGWRFVYDKEIITPAELPVMMDSLKSQQFRWSKGAAECARKHFVNLMTSKNISAKTKIVGFFHLTNSWVFFFITMLALFSLPVLHIQSYSLGAENFYRFGYVFVVSFIILVFFYWTSERQNSKLSFTSVINFVLKFPLFISFSMGLSLHNCVAVIEGLLGKKTPFIRTPKLAGKNKLATSSVKTDYITSKISLSTWLDLFFLVYCTIGFVYAYSHENYGFIPFYVLLIIGFGALTIYTFMDYYKINTLS